jgi:hypothetical protein
LAAGRSARNKDPEISTRSSDGIAEPPARGNRIRLIVFRVLATLAGLFFLIAVVLAVPAPWMLLQPDDPHAAENRWFLTVAGSVDAIAVVMFFALVQRPRRTLLWVEMSAAVVIAAVIVLPFGPLFAAILAVAVAPLVAYPYWRDARSFPSWWAGVPRAPLILAALSGVALLMTAAVALPREIGGTDAAAQANWWSDYAEHATILAVTGVLAASRGPDWRILRTACAAVWLYPGLSPVRSFHTTPGRGVASAVSPGSLSASVLLFSHAGSRAARAPIYTIANHELTRTPVDGQTTSGVRCSLDRAPAAYASVMRQVIDNPQRCQSPCPELGAGQDEHHRRSRA